MMYNRTKFARHSKLFKHRRSVGRNNKSGLLASLLLLLFLTLHADFGIILRDATSIVDESTVRLIGRSLTRKPKATVAYVVTLTGCNHEAWTESLIQGAAVLRHSIFLNSIRNPESGSLYDFKMYAFVHPSAEKCLKHDDSLSRLGYEIMVREVPFDRKKIKGELLRNEIKNGGCCGEKEYLKLYGYTLTDHKIVVLLDLDAMVREPLDDLFDSMLDSNSPARKKLPVMFGKEAPKRIDAFYTRDYNMLNPGEIQSGINPGIQGGFLVLRPDLAVFEEYIEIVLEGHFTEGGGWGDANYGHYYGDKAIQGICSYYYGHLHPEYAVELNRCFYNTMVDNMYFPEAPGVCITGEESCTNCRRVDYNEVKSVHFTECQKPWWCFEFDPAAESRELCNTFHEEWFRVREDLEDRWAKEEEWTPTKKADGGDKVFRSGFCKGSSEDDYIPLTVPTSLKYA